MVVLECRQGGLFVEITGRIKRYFVRRNMGHILNTKNRKRRKILARLGLLSNARRINVEIELSAAQIRRLQQTICSIKSRTRHPKPGQSFQIYQKKAVIGNERDNALLARGTTVEIIHISRQIAKLIQASTEERQNLDHRAVFMKNKKGRLGFMFFATNHFIALGKIPAYTRFKVLRVPCAMIPEPEPELTISLEIQPQKQA